MANHTSFPISGISAGIANMKITERGMSTTDILSHGMNLLPLLNLILSMIAPKMASFTPSHILTSSMTSAIFSGSMPCISRYADR